MTRTTLSRRSLMATVVSTYGANPRTFEQGDRLTAALEQALLQVTGVEPWRVLAGVLESHRITCGRRDNGAGRLVHEHPGPCSELLARAIVDTLADRFGNVVAREGCTRCPCGAKYWEADRCVSCGGSVDQVPAADR